jgi:hypothetical protein
VTFGSNPAATHDRTTWRAHGLVADVWTQSWSRRSPSVSAGLPASRLAGESVLGWKHDEHGVLEQQLSPEPRAVPLSCSRELEQQGEIEFAGAQPRRDLLGLTLRKRQRDVRMPIAEGGDRERHQRGAGGRERRHAQATGPHAQHRSQVGLGGLDPREDPLGVLDQAGPGGGRPHAAPIPDDQRRPGLGLEPGDRLRHGRLGVTERLGGGRERAPSHHLREHPNAPDIQH